MLPAPVQAAVVDRLAEPASSSAHDDLGLGFPLRPLAEHRGPVQEADAADADAWNLAQTVYQHSQTQPQALAVWADGESLSYGALAQQAAGLAACLTSSAGWPGAGEPAPRVGILGSRSAQAAVAVLGANWAGATYVPLGLKLPEERLLSILSRCGLSALVVDEQGAALLSQKVLQAAPAAVYALGRQAPVLPHKPEARRVRWLSPSRLAAVPAHPSKEAKQPEQTRPALAAPPPMQPSDAAYIIFTSGTTGVPKGVVVPISAVHHYVPTMRALLGLVPSDRVLDTFELSFDVSVHNLFCTWEAGACLHILPAARVMNAVSFAREQAITVWNSVPSLVGMLRQVKALGPGALPLLRVSSFGGEPLAGSIVQTWQAAAPGSRIFNLYGPTEATVTCAAQEVSANEPLPVFAGRDVVAIGQALPGCELAVFDAQGQAITNGQPGELAIAGAQLALGYLNAPALTAARFVQLQGQRWYLTGDLAAQDDSGRFHCLGRLDNQVKVLGNRVELEEIDAHVRQVLGNPMVATVAWPLVNGAAQGLVTFVGAPALDEAATLRALQALKAQLPLYMVPARLLAVADMPLNANGKIDRQALRQGLDSGAR